MVQMPAELSPMNLGMPMPPPIMQAPVNPELNQFQFNNSREQVVPRQQPNSAPPVSIPGAPDAVQQYIEQTISPALQKTKPLVVRRNLTVAEVIVLFIAAIGCVAMTQVIWDHMPKPSFKIEWKS